MTRAVPDPDLEIREEGHPDPQKIFWHFGSQFGLKIRGGGCGLPMPLPWICHCKGHAIVKKTITKICKMLDIINITIIIIIIISCSIISKAEGWRKGTCSKDAGEGQIPPKSH